MDRLLYYYKDLRLEMLRNIQNNKSWIETYNSSSNEFIGDRIKKIKVLLMENIEYYKHLKCANNFIQNYNNKKTVCKQIKIEKIVNTDEDTYDNTLEDKEREDFVKQGFDNYLYSLQR